MSAPLLTKCVSVARPLYEYGTGTFLTPTALVRNELHWAITRGLRGVKAQLVDRRSVPFPSFLVAVVSSVGHLPQKAACPIHNFQEVAA